MEKLAFIHIVRTGGGSVNSHLMNQLPKIGYEIFNSWKTMDRDYSDDELIEISKTKGKVYVHNHSMCWSQNVVDIFHEKGWKFFTFIRPLGDQLCSLHFFKDRFFIGQTSTAENLDYWLNIALFDNSWMLKYQIPDYWQQIDQIWRYGDIDNFLWTNFKINIEEDIHIHKTENKGYNFYRKFGFISEQTDSFIEKSDLNKRYYDACRLSLCCSLL
jgi:hypothetical protein